LETQNSIPEQPAVERNLLFVSDTGLALVHLEMAGVFIGTFVSIILLVSLSDHVPLLVEPIAGEAH